MKHKLLATGAAVGLAALFAGNVSAADVGSAVDLADCLSGEDTVCTLTDNITLTEMLTVNRDLSLDLNGHNIVPSGSFDLIAIDGGSLNVVGSGTIGTDSSWSAFRVYGTTDSSKTYYSTLTVGKDVTLKADDYAVWVPSRSGHAYGAVVNFDGAIDAAYGFYINGNVQDIAENAPQFNIGDDATITTSGHAVYAAGYGVWNFGAAKIDGVDGIGIKAGTFDFDGTDIAVTGAYVEPASWNNGMNSSGATIQIESNDGYADNIHITIHDGAFSSKNGHVFYEYKNSEATTNTVKDVTISGGSFVAGNGKTVFQVSDNFTLENFIEGGVFSTAPEASYVDSDKYSVFPIEDGFMVAAKDGEVDPENELADDDGDGVYEIMPKQIEFDGDTIEILTQDDGHRSISFALKNGVIADRVDTFGFIEGDEEDIAEIQALNPDYPNMVFGFMLEIYNDAGEVVDVKDNEITFRYGITKEQYDKLKEFDKVVVYHISEEDETEWQVLETIDAKLLEPVYNEDYDQYEYFIEFTTSHLSVYVVAGENEEEATEAETATPDTGRYTNDDKDSIISNVGIGIISAIILTIAGLFIAKRSMKKA